MTADTDDLRKRPYRYKGRNPQIPTKLITFLVPRDLFRTILQRLQPEQSLSDFLRKAIQFYLDNSEKLEREG